ncbi:TerB family tellurite resistance protein [Cellvibrio sp. PSBB006]|uniref:tellurite resistance TerB family protein n=1 Tax=Cellvibrio sp. PSBB006 TaxID=1987723 RepID=UPI000B3B89E6|nr:TerB family tellurite resistance protein [Cellvibrio sp. PSBB006]ARU27107.1 hypothetical protein CBR65_06440 [Cellvibrio sp. PSBB006]
MLSKLSSFFERHLQPAGGASPSLSFAQKQLAVAALLIEVATADHVMDGTELNALVNLLERKFSLPHEQLLELADLAKTEAAEATSLYQFTQLINNECTASEKFELIKGMWEIAYADNQLDKYEEYVIRKVADLIHVSHSDFIRAKSIVRAEIG